MPNYCENDLFIYGKTADLRRFFSGLKHAESGKFSIIASYYPMPEELKNTTSPSIIVESQEEKAAHIKEQDDLGLSEHSRTYPITREESLALIEKYGANNWYDWKQANWETKWGDFEHEIKEPIDEDYDSDDEQRVYITFRTAWSPPNMARVFALFPELEFSLYSYEQGMAYQEGQEWKHGELIDAWRHAYHGARGG